MGPPPSSMITPHGTQITIFTLVAAVLVVMLGLSVFEWRRTGRPLMLALVAGGLICCLNESMIDVLGHCYFPVRGAWEGQTLFGRGIPLWVDLTYASFFGAFPYGLSLLLKRGTSRARMWLALAAWGALDLILEIPLLGTHLYVYYGQQPFKVAGYPLEWLTINVIAVFMTAVVVARFADQLKGRHLLLLLLVPLATDVASVFSDLPAFWALTSHAATWVKYVGVSATIVIELFELDALIRFGRRAPGPPLVRPDQRRSPTSARAGTDVPPAPESTELQTA